MKHSFLKLIVALFCVGAARAQEAIGPFISTIGTTVRENGRDWAYLLWTANMPSLLSGQSHAIYSKAGDANSGGPFTRMAIVSLQAEAITLEPLLKRGVILGDNTNTLEMDIDALFGKLIPGNLSLPEKLSAIVRGGMKEDKHFGRMILLSRTHPSVAMALGFAHAELIPAGQTTFEVREFNRVTQTDGTVIGRVTVAAGAPVILPPPGAPVELKQDNARGHLNAQLRWGVPDDLRRMSLLQHGFNVWRVRKDFSDARNWETTPPTASALVGANNTAVRMVNHLPLMSSKTFNIPDAADFVADPTTFFIIDDNDRGRSNTVSTLDFTNGARFVYFVTARDILGRNGSVSPGTEVQICTKLPPDPVTEVEVANDSVFVDNQNRQRLRVLWPQAPNLPLSEQQIRTYWIYRWPSVTEMRLKQANRTNNLIAKINHIAGQSVNSYLDNGDGAPTGPGDLGKTFYYTIRAEDDGACESNLSPHSAPAFGVLRDRSGPRAPTGTITATCFEPSVRFLTRTTNDVETPTSGFHFSLVGVRGDRRIAWMQFEAEVRVTGQSLPLQTFTSPRLAFGNGAPGAFVSFPFTVPRNTDGEDVSIRVAAGFANGEFTTTNHTESINRRLSSGAKLNVAFGADIRIPAKETPCDSHFSVGVDGHLEPIDIELQPMAGSKEVRVYRRVDDGPLELIYQKPLETLVPVGLPDDSFPHGGGKVCYYACTLDEHGNSSPLTRLGCQLVFENSAPPRPLLSPIESSGPPDAPRMNISWFCPGANIDRFEVGIATLGDPISANCAPGYLQLIPAVPQAEPIISQIAAAGGLPALDLNLEFRRFITPRPGPDFGENDRYRVSVDIELDRRYLVYVKSIGKSGARSDRSNIETFFWQATPLEQPDVPWPPRPLPPVGNSFNLDFGAFLMAVCDITNQPVVQIAFKGFTDRDGCPQALNLGSYPSVDPNSLLPTNDVGDSIFPVALFRQQVANGNFPNVSGDVSQVSPLMETIAWGQNGQESVILDPFVHLAIQRGTVGSPGAMYLKDLQPVITGARYRYFLARFSKLGEIVEVIPAANELDAP